MELPSVQELYETYGDEIEFIAVNTRDNPDDGREYYKNEKFTFPVLYDDELEIADLYRVQPIPLNIFIDKDGVIKYKKLGAIPKEDIEWYLNDVSK